MLRERERERKLVMHVDLVSQLSTQETGISGSTGQASWARPPSLGWPKRTNSGVAILREHLREKDGMTDSIH